MNAIDLSYKFPEAVYLLLLLPVLLAILLWGNQKRKDAVRGYAPKGTLQRMIVPRSRLKSWFQIGFLCLAWIFATFALMQPRGNSRYSPEASEKVTESSIRYQERIVLVVDASESMTVMDGRGGQTRFAQAKEIADLLLGELHGEPVALLAFTSDLTPLSPPTTDYLYVRLMLRNMQINEGNVSGTDFTRMLKQLNQWNESQRFDRPETWIILSDGGDNAIEDLQGADRQQAANAIADLIPQKPSQPITVQTIGIGTPEGRPIPGMNYQGNPVESRLDEELMHQIALKGHGKYYPARNFTTEKLAKILLGDIDVKERHDAVAKEQLSQQNAENLIYDDYFQIPLVFAILALAIALLIPEGSAAPVILKKLTLPMILIPFVLNASPATQEQNEQLQRAAAFLEAENYTKAKEIYNSFNPIALSHAENAVVKYDEGFLLLKEGKFEESIQLFQEVLHHAPESPLLLRNLNKNLALAYLRYASTLSLKQKGPLEQYLFQNNLYQMGNAALDQAIQADCELMRLKGAVECIISSDLKMMQQSFLNHLAEIKSLIKESAIFSSPFMSKLFRLYTAQQAVIRDISFLQKESTPEDLRIRYVDAFIGEADTWIPLWNELKEWMQKEIAANHAKQSDYDLLISSQKNYKYALRFLEKEDFESSRKLIDESQNSLLDLVKSQWSAEATDALMIVLQQTMDEVIDNPPLTLSSLLVVESMAKFIHSFLKAIGKESEWQHQTFADISKQVSEAVLVFKEYGSSLALLYLMEANQEIRRHIAAASLHQSPIDILKQVVQEQHHALSLNSGMTDAEADKIKQFVLHAQQLAVAASSSFLEKVYAYQKDRFEDYATSPKSRCQYAPWNEVLPRFNDGFLEAKNSLDLLNTSFSLAIETQKKAFDDWREALANLENPKKSSACNWSPPQSVEKQPQNKQAASAYDVLQDLQQMQDEDNKPKKETQPLKQGLRPW